MTQQTTKLSTLTGFSGQGTATGGAVNLPSYGAEADFDILDDQLWVLKDEGANQYVNDEAGHGNEHAIVQCSNEQFATAWRSNNSNQSNRIYWTIIPFQVDLNTGAVTKGVCATTENSSSTSVSTTFGCGQGHTNPTSDTVQGIPANSAHLNMYGRMHWSGSYNCMNWGGYINTAANSVQSIGRNSNSDYSASYPHPSSGTWVMSGGKTYTAYYHMVGYQQNSYIYQTRFEYASGAPNYNTNNQLSTYTSSGGAYPVPQTWDCGWDHHAGYWHHNTGSDYSFGLISATGDVNNINTMQGCWPKMWNRTSYPITPFRMAEDKTVWMNNDTGEYYTQDPSATSFQQSTGSPLQMDAANFRRYKEVTPSSWNKYEKPIRSPQTQNAKKTLYTSQWWKDGFMVKKYTLDDSNVFEMEYAYANPYISKPGSLPGNNNFGYGWAGTNNNILVTAERQNHKIRVRTYDLSKMFISMGID